MATDDDDGDDDDDHDDADDDDADDDDDHLHVACYLGAPVPHVTPGRACHMLPRAKQSNGRKRRGKQGNAMESRSFANQMS